MQNQNIDQNNMLAFAGAMAMGIAGAALMMIVDPSPVKALVGFAAGIGLFGALISAEAALYCCITVACMDGFIKGMSLSMSAMLVKDIFLGIALVHWIWDGLNGNARNSLATKIAAPAFIFMIYCTAQMFNSETASWMLAVAGLRSWIIWIPIFFIAYDTLSTRFRFERFILFIALISAATGIYIIIQQQTGFDYLYQVSDGFLFYDDFENSDQVRAPGTYVNPGTAGAAMSFAALICLGIALANRAFSFRQMLLLTASVICFVAMGATGSRAPLIGAAIGVVTFLSLSGRPSLLIPILLIGILTVNQASKYAGTLIDKRYSLEKLNLPLVWDRMSYPLAKGYTMLLSHPFGTGVASGVGAGRAFNYVKKPMEVSRSAWGFVENELGRAMKELGLPGFLIYVWLLWQTVAVGLRGWLQTRGRDRLLSAGLIAGGICMIIQLMVGSALYLAPGGIYFWAACALAARIPDYIAQDAAALVPKLAEEQVAEWNALKQRTQTTV